MVLNKNLLTEVSGREYFNMYEDRRTLEITKTKREYVYYYFQAVDDWRVRHFLKNLL